MAQIDVHYRPQSSVQRAGGFSLVELMVAMAISLFLMAGVIAIFLSSRSSYETTDKLSRIQENGRFALDQLTHDVRAAGYVGCSRTTNYLSTSLQDTTNVLYDFLAGSVQGYQYVSGVWAPALPAEIPAPDATNGSDILVLRIPARDATPLSVQADMTTGADPLTVPDVTDAFQPGDIALAYSCEAQAFFQVTGYGGGTLEHKAGGSGPGNAVDTISYAFRKNAEVVPVNTVVYFVGKSLGSPTTTTSLFRLVNGSATGPEELVEGVEQMQVDYGIDSNLDDVVDKYDTAENITDWKRVFSVRIAMLVRSQEQYGTDTDQRTYVLLSGADEIQVVAPADRHFRQVFAATVGIRNKVVIN